MRSVEPRRLIAARASRPPPQPDPGVACCLEPGRRLRALQGPRSGRQSTQRLFCTCGSEGGREGGREGRGGRWSPNVLKKFCRERAGERPRGPVQSNNVNNNKTSIDHQTYTHPTPAPQQHTRTTSTKRDTRMAKTDSYGIAVEDVVDEGCTHRDAAEAGAPARHWLHCVRFAHGCCDVAGAFWLTQIGAIQPVEHQEQDSTEALALEATVPAPWHDHEHRELVGSKQAGFRVPTKYRRTANKTVKNTSHTHSSRNACFFSLRA